MSFEVATTIRNQIGFQTLVCLGAKNLKGGPTDNETHDGYLEFTAENNPKISEKVKVRVELAFNDTYRVLVSSKSSTHADHSDIYCDQLSELLFEILG